MHKTVTQIFTILSIIGIIWCAHPLQSEISQNNKQIFTFGNIDRLLNKKTLDSALLEKAIIYYTNKVRQERGIKPCIFHLELRNVARKHSREMVRLKYFSHQSPVKANRELSSRIKNEGINIKPVPGQTIVMGENIAEPGSNKDICRGSTAYRIFPLTSLSTAS